MPGAWRVRVVEERLKREGLAAQGREVDFYQMDGAIKDAVLDEYLKGADLPMVLVDGRVVCTGGIDLDAVVEAAKAAD
ncbi:MAG: hypothetical protein Kow0056_08290 [Coriobacteriia bacterium]